MFKNVIAGGVLGVVVLAAILAIRKYLQEDGVKIEEGYEDVIGIGHIKEYFRDKSVSGDIKGIVIYPTTENINKYKGLKDVIKEGNNHLYLVVYDTVNEKVICCKKYGFSSISDQVKDVIDQNGGIVVLE